jgi:antitoxin (DNA-binding transcriptional repressor) of toxin-antitoxin stability system
MDSVESGRSFTVTRDGHEIGKLIPAAPRHRRFVSRAEFVAMSRNAAYVDIDAFRADQEAALDQEPRDFTGAQPSSPPGEQPSRHSTP